MTYSNHDTGRKGLTAKQAQGLTKGQLQLPASDVPKRSIPDDLSAPLMGPRVTQELAPAVRIIDTEMVPARRTVGFSTSSSGNTVFSKHDAEELGNSLEQAAPKQASGEVQLRLPGVVVPAMTVHAVPESSLGNLSPQDVPQSKKRFPSKQRE